jgi:hypothetical protein
MDLFMVPTVSFRLLYGLLIMSHGRRQILWLGVTAQPTATEWIANQLTAACGWDQSPRDLIRDRGCHNRMITQEPLPALGRRSSPARHILSDAGLPNVDAELEQFAMNARRTPQWVGNAHLPD